MGLSETCGWTSPVTWPLESGKWWWWINFRGNKFSDIPTFFKDEIFKNPTVILGNSGCKIQIAFQMSIDFGSIFLWFWMCTFRDVPRNRDSSPVERFRLRDHCFRGGTGTKIWRSEMKLSTESSGEIYEPKQTEPSQDKSGAGYQQPCPLRSHDQLPPVYQSLQHQVFTRTFGMWVNPAKIESKGNR